MRAELSSTFQMDETPPPAGGARIYADGEMADRIRRFHWASTPLGPISGWSDHLIWAANLMLESQFPTILFWGTAMTVLYNDAYQPLMAEKHPQALGQPASECWKEAWHIIGPQCRAVMQKGEKFHFEDVLVPVLRQGSLCDVYWTYSYSPVRDAGGTIAAVLVVCHDMTAKLAAERERDTVASNLKNVLESTTDGLAVLDPEWKFTYVNDRGARILSLTPQQMIGNCLWALFPLASDIELGGEFRRAIESGKPSHFDGYYPEPLNLWLECHCYPSSHGLSIYFRDATEQKKTEKALRTSEFRFRKLFDSGPMGIGMPDRFGGFRDCNDQLLAMTGYTRADFEAGLVRWDTMTPPEYAEVDRAHILEAIERGSCTPYEKEYLRKDGTRVPIICGYAQLDGSRDEYIGFALDLSEQKRAAGELREQEERFRVLSESLPQFIWMTNVLGHNIYCNQRFIDYSGLTQTDMMGPGWKNLIHPDDLEPTMTRWNLSLKDEEPHLNEYRLRRKDGVYRHFLARAVPLRNDRGEVERWIGSSTDIHDQKLAEEALRKSEKLATAGRLAASIAHEINNPLAGVTNALYLALQDNTLSTDTKGYLQTAEQELRRVAHITTQTLRFHKQSNSPGRVDISDIVDSVLALFSRRLTGKNILVKTECEKGAIATCFGDEVRQVIANLLTNAMDATPEDGLIRIRVKKARDWSQDRSDGVRIVVADSGHGIPDAVLGHIFEPFITTKEATGIGLGLWVSDGIVRKHGGAIRVRSKANVQPSGTVFTVFIPSVSTAR